MSSGGRLSVLAIAAATLLSGCGGDDPTIPAAQGEDLVIRLDEVEGAVAEGNCDGAQASANLFVQQVDQLPASVDDEVKRALLAGGERLQELATEECEEPDTGATGESGFIDPEETVEQPAIEPPEEETTEEPQTDDESQQPDEGEGNDQGAGQDDGSNGNAGGNQGGGTGPGTGGVGGDG